MLIATGQSPSNTHCLPLEGREWKFWCDSNLRTKFWRRSIQLDPVGVLTLEFDDGEIFQWSKVCIVVWLCLCKILTAQLSWSCAFLFYQCFVDILKHDHAILRSLQLFIILSSVKFIVVTMGQCTYMVIANIHANSSLKNSLFLTEILARLVLHPTCREFHSYACILTEISGKVIETFKFHLPLDHRISAWATCCITIPDRTYLSNLIVIYWHD